MTTIATFTTPEEAHLFRAYLGDQGIDAFLNDEHFVQLFWNDSNTIGGVRLVVDDSDVDDATGAYKTYMNALRDGPYLPAHKSPQKSKIIPPQSSIKPRSSIEDC